MLYVVMITKEFGCKIAWGTNKEIIQRNEPSNHQKVKNKHNVEERLILINAKVPHQHSQNIKILDKMYLYAKDPHESKYQLLVNKHEKVQ